MNSKGKALSPDFKIPTRLINIGLLLQTIMVLAGIFLFFFIPQHYGFSSEKLYDYPDLVGVVGAFILFGVFGVILSEKYRKEQYCAKQSIWFGVAYLVVTLIATFGLAYWWYAYFANASANLFSTTQLAQFASTDTLELQHNCYNYIFQGFSYISGILILSAGVYLAGIQSKIASIKESGMENVDNIHTQNGKEPEEKQSDNSALRPSKSYRRVQHNVKDAAINHPNPNLTPENVKNLGANDVMTKFKKAPAEEKRTTEKPQDTPVNENKRKTSESQKKENIKNVSKAAEEEESLSSQDIQEFNSPEYRNKLDEYLQGEDVDAEKDDIQSSENPKKSSSKENNHNSVSDKVVSDKNTSHSNPSHSNPNSSQNHNENQTHLNNNQRKNASNKKRKKRKKSSQHQYSSNPNQSKSVKSVPSNPNQSQSNPNSQSSKNQDKASQSASHVRPRQNQVQSSHQLQRRQQPKIEQLDSNESNSD